MLRQYLPQLITCRSREGAWIEMRPIIASYAFALVALARECGLKFHESCKGGCNFVIRSHKGAWIEIRNMVGFSVLLMFLITEAIMCC